MIHVSRGIIYEMRIEKRYNKERLMSSTKIVSLITRYYLKSDENLRIDLGNYFTKTSKTNH